MVQRQTASPIQLPSIAHSTQSVQHYSHDDRYSQLQLQLQHHSGVLEDQRRLIEDTRQYVALIEEQRRELEDTRQHLSRIERAIETLHREQGNIIAVVNEVRAGVNARPGPHDRTDSAELDILAERLQHVSAQANEVEGLKMQVDLMRSQLRRIERHASPAAHVVDPATYEHNHAPHAQAPFVTQTPSQMERAPFYQTPSETRLAQPALTNSDARAPEHPPPAAADTRTLPGFRTIDSAPPPVVSSWRPAGGFAPTQPPPSGAPATSTPQAESQASGWAAVNSNSGTKRPDNPSAYESPLPGSPKRQKLAPLMPRTEQNPTGPSSPYIAGATPESLPPVPSLIASRGPSNDSRGSVPPTSNNLRFVQFAQQDAAQEEAWYAENHRESADSGARGSPRRGRGGRGRGGRRSGGADCVEQASPGYDRTADWSTVAQATTAAGGYGTPGSDRGSLVRRGAGLVGGPSDRPSETPESQQTQPLAASLYPDPHFMPITTTADVASSTQPTKKTRTKPIRNAEGILIRKDGRPDMRSVSSAMNLKKVHAKKEAERSEKGRSMEDDKGAMHTPQSTSEHDHDHEGSGDISPSTPSAERELNGVDVHGTQDKHEKNMRRIFPYGVPDEQKVMAQQFFPRPEENNFSGVKTEMLEAHDNNPGAAAKPSDKDSHNDHNKHDREVNQGPMPLLDGVRSMVEHDKGDVEMEDPHDKQ
ncbi:hypothetical protein MBLNU459_g3112t1 [Dothideomycetes sp. NU459]